MTDIVRDPSLKIIESVQVAITRADRDNDGYVFFEGVMQGIKAGIVAIQNPELAPGEVIEEANDEYVIQTPEEKAQFYRGLFIGAITAPNVLRLEKTTEEKDGEK